MPRRGTARPWAHATDPYLCPGPPPLPRPWLGKPPLPACGGREAVSGVFELQACSASHLRLTSPPRDWRSHRILHKGHRPEHHTRTQTISGAASVGALCGCMRMPRDAQRPLHLLHSVRIQRASRLPLILAAASSLCRCAPRCYMRAASHPVPDVSAFALVEFSEHAAQLSGVVAAPKLLF